MRIYCDCCCLQRPLDDQRQPRIKVESEAVLVILAAVQNGELTLLGSDVLSFEINRTPSIGRRSEVLAMASMARHHIELDDLIVASAKSLERSGVKPMDALHLASAMSGQADFFATCDDRLITRTATLSNLSCKVMSPLELILEITK